MNYFADISFDSHASSIITFDGSNFSEWSEQIQFTLAFLNLDFALLKDKPIGVTDSSGEMEKSYLKAWERSNRLSLMLMQNTIADIIKSTIPRTENATEYLKFVEEKFLSINKPLVGTLVAQLMDMKFDRSQNMQEYIIEITNITTKLKNLGMVLGGSFLVHFILNSLPSEYRPFQINYNIIKDKWSVIELTTMLIQEEARLKSERGYSIEAGKKLKKKINKVKNNKKELTNKHHTCNKEQKSERCYFCKKVGHIQKDCLKRMAWFEKKGIFSSSRHFRSNLSEFYYNL